MEENNINSNIIENAYGLISFFNEKNNLVTNLHLQKLMYFMEAYYMAKTDESLLFDCEWVAWPFGPVCIDLYEEFKVNRNNPIELDENSIDYFEELPLLNRTLIESCYELFGEIEATELVNLSHLKGSPWSKVYNPKDEQKKIINKILTREWFRDTIGFSSEES